MIELIENLRKDGTLGKLIRAGLLSGKIYRYHEIVITFDSLRKQGFGVLDAYCICGEKLKCSQSTVIRALKALQYEDSSSNTNSRG